MNNIFYIWLSAAIFFLIAEMITVTFYWLSMSIASFVVVAYVYFMNESTFTVPQFIIFTVISTILVFVSPKIFKFNFEDKKIWNEWYIWKEVKLKKVWGDFKITLDWVDYLVDDECITDDFKEWKKVIVEKNNAWAFMVKIKWETHI